MRTTRCMQVYADFWHSLVLAISFSVLFANIVNLICLLRRQCLSAVSRSVEYRSAGSPGQGVNWPLPLKFEIGSKNWYLAYVDRTGDFWPWPPVEKWFPRAWLNTINQSITCSGQLKVPHDMQKLHAETTKWSRGISYALLRTANSARDWCQMPRKYTTNTTMSIDSFRRQLKTFFLFSN